MSTHSKTGAAAPYRAFWAGASHASRTALMAKRSLLGWFDQGNQRAMDYVRSQPDAGSKVLPYAKSDSARRWGIVIAVVVCLVGFFLGWVGALIAFVVAAPIGWRLEHHFFFQRSHNGGTVDQTGVEEGSTTPQR